MKKTTTYVLKTNSGRYIQWGILILTRVYHPSVADQFNSYKEAKQAGERVKERFGIECTPQRLS